MALPGRSGTIAMAAVLLSGCGVKGPPVPPPPRESMPITALRVRQQGAEIVVSFSPPVRRTDGKPLDLPVRFEILAHVAQRPTLVPPAASSTKGPGAPDAPDVPEAPDAPKATGTVDDPALGAESFPKEPSGESAKGPVRIELPRPGRREVEMMMRQARKVKLVPYEPRESPGREEVRLGGDELSGVRLEAARIAFGVAVLDGRGRRTQARTVAFIDPVPPPPPPSQVIAEVLESGVLLSWKRPDLSGYTDDRGEAGLAVYRWLAGGEPSGRAFRVLRPDADGFMDEGAAFGEDFVYEVRTTVGDAARRLESTAAGPVTVSVRDTFPPGVPEGLTALAADDGIRLFWYPSKTGDIGGYLLYRSLREAAPHDRAEGGIRPAPEGRENQFERLTPSPVVTTTWLDREVEPGRTYAYRISAVDRADPPNESARSGAVLKTAGLPGSESAPARPGGNP